VETYEPALFGNGTLAVPQSIAAHMGEISLLSGIAACRLRPARWKSNAEETINSAQKLLSQAGHVLPSEYELLASETRRKYNANSASVLRVSQLRSRPESAESLAADAILVLRALTRLRFSPSDNA
jgi:hypothetical protein